MVNLRTPYGCTICKKAFSNPVSLIKHIDWRHPTKKIAQTSSKVNNKISETKSVSTIKTITIRV